MMPVPENSQPMDTVDYKKKYTALKRKLRFLLYEHECFLEELRKSQRKLLKVSRDKSFLLDRLLNYEKVDSSSSDSEATASSESEGEGTKEGSASKKKKLSQPASMPAPPEPSTSLLSTMGFAAMIQSQGKPTVTTAVPKVEVAKKKVKVTKKAVHAKPGSHVTLVKTSSGTATVVPVSMLGQSILQAAAVRQVPQVEQMTREELERHLEMKQNTKPQFMSLEKTPNSLPDDIFSNDNSNP